MSKERVIKIARQMIEDNGLINLSCSDLCNKSHIPFGSFPHIMGCNFSEFIEQMKNETDENKAFKSNKKRAVSSVLRKDQILNVAIDLSKKYGYQKIKRSDISHHAGVSENLISNYFGTMIKLKRLIIRHAIKNNIIEIIAQGIANNDPHVKKASKELKEKAIKLISSY